MGSRDHSYECETCGYLRGGMNNDECECLEERAPEWQGPMHRDCGSCNFMRHMHGRAWCAWCRGDIAAAARTLAHNLAVAGGLCLAHDIGIQNSHDWGCSEPCEVCWSPGCGKAWEGR